MTDLERRHQLPFRHRFTYAESGYVLLLAVDCLTPGENFNRVSLVATIALLTPPLVTSF